MNKILLHNFPHPKRSYLLDGGKLQSFFGFEPTRSQDDCRRDLCSAFVLALLIHEKLCIESAHLLELVEIFGVSDANALLDHECIEIIRDANFQPVVVAGDKGIQSGTMVLSSPPLDDQAYFDRLRTELEDKWAGPKTAIDRFVNSVWENSIVLEEVENLSQFVCSEVEADLLNHELTELLGVTSHDRQNIFPSDIYKMLRLFHINHGLIYSSMLRTDTLMIDGALSDLWNAKLSPLLRSYKANSHSVFQAMLENKAIPDPSDLYLQGTISIHDVLDIRDDIEGRRFRDWFHGTGYDPAVIAEAVRRKRPWTRSPLIKALRWVTPKLVGTVCPPLGVAASLVDSYVLDKFVQGWHPNFFFDDKLKVALDRAIRNHEQALKTARQIPW